MEGFLSGSVLPFTAVCATIAGLTFAAFDVPSKPPPPPAPSTQPALPPTPSLVSGTGGAGGAPNLNETLAQALRTLDHARTVNRRLPSAAPAGVGSTSAFLGADTVAAPSLPGGSDIFAAVSALGNAVKAVRDARTEEDIVHAEQEVRTAREKMEATCGGAGGPLCDSAQEIRSLGY